MALVVLTRVRSLLVVAGAQPVAGNPVHRAVPDAKIMHQFLAAGKENAMSAAANKAKGYRKVASGLVQVLAS